MLDAIKPEPLSRWQHTNGNVYTVLLLTNEGTTNPTKYPITVVYQGQNGLVWSRPLKDWHRSMMQISIGTV